MSSDDGIIDDDGILDNDTAAEGLTDIEHEVAGDIARLGASKPSAAAAAKLAAAVGVLLQLSSYEFDLEAENGPKIATAVKAHATEIAKLPAAARKILALVAAGNGKALAERRAKMSVKQIGFLTATGRSPFGKREPALFESKAAAAYVRRIAKLCVDKIDEDFEDEDNWSDLRRDGVGGVACLGILLVLDPCKVPVSKIDRWRRNAMKGLRVLEEEPDDELDFYRGYYANLDAVLGLLAKRFTS